MLGDIKSTQSDDNGYSNDRHPDLTNQSAGCFCVACRLCLPPLTMTKIDFFVILPLCTTTEEFKSNNQEVIEVQMFSFKGVNCLRFRPTFLKINYIVPSH